MKNPIFVLALGTTCGAPTGVSSYVISTTDGGTLTKVGDYVSKARPAGVAVTPSGAFLYVANYSGTSVGAFGVAVVQVPQ